MLLALVTFHTNLSKFLRYKDLKLLGNDECPIILKSYYVIITVSHGIILVKCNERGTREGKGKIIVICFYSAKPKTNWPKFASLWHCH